MESQVEVWLHLLAFATYLGATAAVLLISLPQAMAERDPERRLRIVVATMRIYDPLTIAALGVLVMTGAFNLTAYKAALRDLFFARLGSILAWKLLLSFFLINLAAYIAFGLGHRVVRSADDSPAMDPARLDNIIVRLRWSMIAALLLAAAIAWVALRLGALALPFPQEPSAMQRPTAARRTDRHGQRAVLECPRPDCIPLAEVPSMERFIILDTRATFAADKMRKNNLFTTANLFCDVYCFEPGQRQAPHSHAIGDKIYYVLEGSGRIQVGNEERDVTAGVAVLAPQGEVHQVLNIGSGRLKLLVFMAPQPA